MMINNDFYPEIGSLIRQYQVIDIAGTGGTAIVLECFDKRRGEKKALKRFLPDKLTRKFEKKIEDEPRLNINSGFLVLAEESFWEDSFLHSAMAFVEGENLSDILDNQASIDLTSAIYTSLCLSKAASDLHARWIISSDIKAENIIITPNGNAKLIDLSNYEKIGNKPEVSGGTEPYAAPELLNRDYLSASTDIYSIGVTLCEMLVGREEFEKMKQSWDLDVQRGFKPDISPVKRVCPEIGRIIENTIDPNPMNRYGSAQDFFDDLLEYYNLLTGAGKRNAELELLCEQGKSIFISKGRTILGRDMIDVRNYLISERHFELSYDGKADAKIRDIGSTNGTSLNGRRMGMAWVDVHDTDVIQIANSQIEVRILS